MTLSKKRKWILIVIGLLIVPTGIGYFHKNRNDMAIDGLWSVDCMAAETAPKEVSLTPKAREHFRKGHSFLKERKLYKARKEFEKAVELSPKTPIAYYWVGMTFFYERQFDKAIAQFNKILQLDPKNYHAMAMIGKVLSFEKNKAEDATRYLNMALAINPEYAEAHSDLAHIYAMRGDISQAVAEFGYIFRSEPRYAVYHYELGMLFKSMKALDRAKKEFQRALVLDPKMTRARDALKKIK